MTSQALNIANQIEALSETEVDFLWDVLRRRHNETLLRTVDIKLEESMNAKTLSDSESAERLAKLGLS